MAIEPQQWKVSWAPHADNKAIVIVTRCESGKPFFAYNRFDITPEMDSATVSRVVIPEGSSACWAGAEVLRNEGDDPTQEYRAEWAMVKVE